MTLDTLTVWLSANPHWLYTSIFLVAFLECLALVGIILPGVVLMMAVTALAGSHGIHLWQVIAIAWAGGLLGDAISYGIGWRFKQDIYKLPLIRNHPHWLTQASVYFERFGAISLLIGRFIGPLRPLLPLTAGMLAMPIAKFVLVSIVAALGWSIAYSLPGWLLGAAADHVTPEFFWRQTLSISAALTFIIALACYGSLRKHRWAMHGAAIAGVLGLGLLAVCWPYLTVFDQYLQQLLQLLRSAQLDQLMVQITKLADLQTQVILVSVLCGLLWLFKQPRAALFMLLVPLSSTLLNSLLKLLITRPRPELLLEPLSGFSFPSGHTAAAFAFCLALGVLAGREQLPRGRIIWLAIAALPAIMIGISRIYLGAHWPTDVIAGMLLASLCCAGWSSVLQCQQPIKALNKQQWLIIVSLLVISAAVFSHWQLAASLAVYRY